MRTAIRETKKCIKKKNRRSKKIKNTLRDFKMYYQYVRGLNSKTNSLAETMTISQHQYTNMFCKNPPYKGGTDSDTKV